MFWWCKVNQWLKNISSDLTTCSKIRITNVWIKTKSKTLLSQVVTTLNFGNHITGISDYEGKLKTTY